MFDFGEVLRDAIVGSRDRSTNAFRSAFGKISDWFLQGQDQLALQDDKLQFYTAKGPKE